MTCAIHYEDSLGDLVEVEYFCDWHCMAHALTDASVEDYEHYVAGRSDEKHLSYGGWPGGSDTDYDVHCGHCEDLLWKGIEND